ncbi:hypothetical protein F4774DRAFT_220407 [Daldinia eschscholtzii]|nr:hypothetical protein F4774DRAFT_220407 [Daldinia eschscholtzii]
MKVQLSRIYGTLALFELASAVGPLEYVGCFGSPTNLKYDGESIFQTVGLCASRCRGQNQLVMAVTNSTACLCGQSTPPLQLEKPDSFCNSRCPGYPTNICGGQGYFSVYYLGQPDELERVPTQEAPSQSIEPVEIGDAHSTVSIENQPTPFVGSSEL